MRLKPYHAPFHMQGFSTTPAAAAAGKKKNGEKEQPQQGEEKDIRPLSWQEFCTRPWTMPRRMEYEMKVTTTTRASHNRTMRQQCRYDFDSSEVIPCLYNPQSNLVPPNRVRGFEPIYEFSRRSSLLGQPPQTANNKGRWLVPPQQPFDSIFELRADKIVHMALELPLLLPNLGGYIAVRYEDILQHGMQPLAEWLSHALSPPTTTTGSSGSRPICARPNAQLAAAQPTLLHHRQAQMPQQYKEWITSHVHPRTERLLGYFV